jgi:hypothetical protein
MLQTQPLEILDFSGGITDHIFSQNATKNAVLDNMTLLSNRVPLTRPGSVVDSLVDGQIPAGAQRIGALINYDNSSKLIVQSAKKLYYRNPVNYATLSGPSGNDAFSSGNANSIISDSQWNKHVYLTSDAYPRPMKFFRDSLGNFRLRSSGLPEFATPPNISIGAVGGFNYVYEFHYVVDYTVDTQTFQTAGPTTIVQLENCADPSLSPHIISSIPVLANGLTENYDTANVKVKIFRTVNNGTVGFLLGIVNNGTTTFLDNYADSAITDNEVIYTTDGSVDNDPPPEAKFVHVINNTGYYASVKVGTEEMQTVVRQSIPFSPDSCPVGFEDQVEDTITGLSSVQSIPIVLCVKHIYRLEGQFDQYGRGFMNHVRISDTAGCVSNRSVVQAENGLFWAGNDGFYHSDGYRVMKISDDNNINYANLLKSAADKKRIYGKYDEANRRVIWGVQSDSASLDNDACWILDLRWGLRADSTFYAWSGSESFAPTALEFFQGYLYRADKRGYVFRHDQSITTDPKINTAVFPATWETQTIIYKIKSIAFNFGSNFLRKWVPRILLSAESRTNISIQINAINDDGKLTRPLKEIRWHRLLIWGDPDFIWGDPNFVWNSEGLIEAWRRFPAKGLRLSYLQIEITNGYTIIANSDVTGTATMNPTTNQAVLNTPSISKWPEKAVDYFLSVESDGYQKQYKITSRTDDTLTVLDIENTFPIGSMKWLVKGYRKGEVLSLISYTIHWANLSKTQNTYESGQDGRNA